MRNSNDDDFAISKNGTTTSYQNSSSAARQPTYDEIAARAYEIYLRSGREEGHSQEHWQQAERELMEQSNLEDHEDLQDEGTGDFSDNIIRDDRMKRRSLGL